MTIMTITVEKKLVEEL